MENPIQAFDHLSKRGKIIAIGGGITLGGVLVYIQHKKNAAAATGPADSSTSADSTATDGTGSSGTQDYTTADAYGDDAGMMPYGNGDPYAGYGAMGAMGGMGSTYPGMGPGGTTGAGDIGNGTLTVGPGDPSYDLLAGIAADVAAQDHTGVTGGGAPASDPTIHQASKTPRHKAKSSPKHVTKKSGTAGAHTTTEHKTTGPRATGTGHAKAKPKAKPKKARHTGARMSFNR
jgi:hypothetical protein